MRQQLLRMHHLFSLLELRRFRQEFRCFSVQVASLVPERIAVRLLVTPERLTQVQAPNEWRFSTRYAVAKVIPIRGP